MKIERRNSQRTLHRDRAPMVIDERALSAIRVTAETPVTLQLFNSIKQKCIESDAE